MTLVEFLRARLDEDLSRHRNRALEAWWYDIDFNFETEIDAKRRIIDEIVPEIEGMESQIESEWALPGESAPSYAEKLLHLLALPYADHPDYQQEWRQ